MAAEGETTGMISMGSAGSREVADWEVDWEADA
jgi:hypothetical protein